MTSMTAPHHTYVSVHIATNQGTNQLSVVLSLEKKGIKKPKSTAFKTDRKEEKNRDFVFEVS